MTGPAFRAVDALSGEVAKRPSAWWAANSEADEFCRELEGLRELQCRVEDLELELAEEQELRMRLVRKNAELKQKLARAESERDTLRAQVSAVAR